MKEKAMERITSSKIVRVAMAMALVLSVAIVTGQGLRLRGRERHDRQRPPYAGYETTQMSADGNDATASSRRAPRPMREPTRRARRETWLRPCGSPTEHPASTRPCAELLVRRKRHGRGQVPRGEPHPALVRQPGSAAEATYGTNADFASWAEREVIGGTWSKVCSRAGEVSTGFSAFRIDTGTDSQELASFTWDRGGVKISKVDAEAGSSEQGDASLEGAEFAIVNASGMNSFVGGIAMPTARRS